MQDVIITAHAVERFWERFDGEVDYDEAVSLLRLALRESVPYERWIDGSEARYHPEANLMLVLTEDKYNPSCPLLVTCWVAQ